MDVPAAAARGFGNFLLDALPDEALATLSPRLERVALPLRMVLETAGEPVTHAYFVTAGVASRVAVSAESKLEIGIVGREGMTGLPAFLETGSSPHQIFMQGEGAGLRMTAEALTASVQELPAFRTVLQKWVHICLVHSSMTALSAAEHTIEQRLARWLVMLQDRLDSPLLDTTHEFLALMLGVQRPGVTLALHTLEGARLIRSERGRVTVIDRDGLIDLAGSGYGVAEAEGRRLFGC